MFDIEKSVELWRSTLPAGMQVPSDRIDELEQHLRDAFEQNIASGATREAAWASALQSLGTSRDIAGEFVKLDRRPWLPARLAAAAMAVLVLATILMLAFTFRARPLLAAHVLTITTAYCGVFAVGFLASVAIMARALFGWDEIRQQSFQIAGRRLALLSMLATIPGIFLGAIWAHQHMGRWWAWDPKEVGGVCVLAWSVVLIKSFASRATLPQIHMIIGVIGNVVVAISWFGPILTGSGYGQVHGYGSAPVGALLSAFLVVQMGLVYLTLLPPRALSARLNGGAQG